MEHFLESLTFFFSAIGVCSLLLTIGFLLGKLFKYFDKESLKTNKKLIKDTIKEVNKNEKDL